VDDLNADDLRVDGLSADDLSVVDDLVHLVVDRDYGDVAGLYLHGSAVVGGLRPDSDLDVLLVTRRSLRADERADLVEFLLSRSGRHASAGPSRPIELTSVVVDDVVPWVYPPMCDVHYGDWLRGDIAGGQVPQRHVEPDLAVLLTSLRQDARALTGPPPAELLDAVPPHDLRRSLVDGLDPLLGDLDGDERNVLLTLARMVVTLDTGQIVSKDEAARRILPTLDPAGRAVLTLALRGYLGEAADDWSTLHAALRPTVSTLTARIRAA
jgi:predicted nucleotidyltransferase